MAGKIALFEYIWLHFRVLSNVANHEPKRGLLSGMPMDFTVVVLLHPRWGSRYHPLETVPKQEWPVKLWIPNRFTYTQYYTPSMIYLRAYVLWSCWRCKASEFGKNPTGIGTTCRSDRWSSTAGTYRHLWRCLGRFLSWLRNMSVGKCQVLYPMHLQYWDIYWHLWYKYWDIYKYYSVSTYGTVHLRVISWGICLVKFMECLVSTGKVINDLLVKPLTSLGWGLGAVHPEIIQPGCNTSVPLFGSKDGWGIPQSSTLHQEEESFFPFSVL